MAIYKLLDYYEVGKSICLSSKRKEHALFCKLQVLITIITFQYFCFLFFFLEVTCLSPCPIGSKILCHQVYALHHNLKMFLKILIFYCIPKSLPFIKMLKIITGFLFSTFPPIESDIRTIGEECILIYFDKLS